LNTFDMLLQAKTDTEFFIVLSSTVHPSSGPYRPEERAKHHVIGTELGRTGSRTEGYALKFEIEQSFSLPNDKGGFTFVRETTHIFTLHQDGTLTWEMLGQPTLTGLKDIQAALKRLRESLEQGVLTETT